MGIEYKLEKSVKAHDCDKRPNIVAKDVTGLVSFIEHLIIFSAFSDFYTSIFQNRTLSDVLGWMVRNLTFVLPVREEPREDKLDKWVNLPTHPRDAPSYGRNVARVVDTPSAY